MEPIFDQAYWHSRLRTAPVGSFHHAIYRCTNDEWSRIEARHKAILAGLIGEKDVILDAGCGWGRLLSLLPPHWRHRDEDNYLGVDLSSDFIDMARCQYPRRRFVIADLRDLRDVLKGLNFDLAVLVSVRPMIIRNAGQQVWDGIEAQLRECCTRLLYLEYDADDKGSLE